MYCPSCGNSLAEGATTCNDCEGTLILAKPHSLHIGEVPITPEGASVAHASFLYEQLLQTLTDYQAQHEEELVKLRGEIEGKIQSLTPKPKVEMTHRLKLNVSDATIVILSFAAAGLTGFIWFIYKLVNFKREIRFDNITVLATTLTVIGSLYLAYDLLGRQRGPLRWVSLFVTSGLIGAIVLEPVALSVAVASQGDGQIIHAFQILLIGILLGSFSGILFAIPENPRHPKIFSGKASIIGGLLGIAFWSILLRIFIVPTGADQYLQILLLATLLGVPSGMMLGGFHHFFRGNYRPGKPPVFSWRSSLKALGIILVIWGVMALLVLTGSSQEQTTIYQGTLVVLFMALSGSIPSGFAPYIFWWLNHFPDRVLGATGFVLTLIGATLPVIQPIVNILSVLKK